MKTQYRKIIINELNKNYGFSLSWLNKQSDKKLSFIDSEKKNNRVIIDSLPYRRKKLILKLHGKCGYHINFLSKLDENQLYNLLKINL